MKSVNLPKNIIIIVLFLAVALFSCKEKNGTVITKLDPPDGIAGNIVTSLNTDLVSYGLSENQSTVICNKAITAIKAENLENSEEISLVAPVVMEGAIASLSEGAVALSNSSEKLEVIETIINSIAESSSGSVSASISNYADISSSIYSSDPEPPSLSSLGSVQASIMNLLTKAAVQNLDEAGFAENEMLNAVKQVSKYLIKSIEKLDVSDSDLATITKDVTKAAIGSIDETGLTGDQIDLAIDVVAAGIMKGLNDYGATTTEISEMADDIAAGVADGLLDAGVSQGDLASHGTTIQDAVINGAQDEAGLTEADTDTIRQDIEDAIDVIVVDTGTGPINPSVSINHGAYTTASTRVTLSLSAHDRNGVTGYYASEDNIAPTVDSNWQPLISTEDCSTDIEHTLTEGNFPKTVYVWFRDARNNISDMTSDSIEWNELAGFVWEQNDCFLDGDNFAKNIFIAGDATGELNFNHYDSTSCAGAPSSTSWSRFEYEIVGAYEDENISGAMKINTHWYAGAIPEQYGYMIFMILYGEDSTPDGFKMSGHELSEDCGDGTSAETRAICLPEDDRWIYYKSE